MTVDTSVETVDLPQEMAAPQAINLIISDTSVKVTEGDMKGTSFTVSLSRGSSTPVSLMIVSGDATVATVDHDVVTFDANETGPKTITVFGTDDQDTVQNSTKLTLSATGVTTASVLVEVADDDVQSIKVMPGQIMMTEGNNEQASVHLAFDPLGTVTVTLTSTNPAKLSSNLTTLTFNSKNYFIPQAVTLTAAEDDDTVDDTVTINVSATGIPTATILVKIIDNDVLNFDSQGSLSLMEGGAGGTISVKLTKKPTANVVVSLILSDDTKAAVSVSTLTFTPDNAETAQMFTVTPKDDSDTKNENIKLTLHADGIADRVIAVSIQDDDTQAIVVSPKDTINLVEGGDSMKLTVRLAFNPGADVTVNIFSSNTAKLSVDQTTLTFTSSNFEIPQLVGLTGQIDDDILDDTAKVTLTASGANSVSVPVTIKDKDVQKILFISSSATGSVLSMNEPAEGGAPRTEMLGVRLAFRPPGPVVVALASSDESKLTLSQKMLTFSPADYVVAQFVTMTPLHDADISNDSVKVTGSSANVPSTTELQITIFDADIENFNAPSMVTVTEPAANAVAAASFDLNLALQPGRQVPVQISSGDTGRVLFGSSGDPGTASTMVYLSNTTAVTIPLIIKHDPDAVNDTVNIKIEDTSTSGPKIPARMVSVLITDIDMMHFNVTLGGPKDPDDMSRLVVLEQLDPADPANPTKGTSATFSVTLSADPVNPVTVNVDPLVSNVVSIDKRTLTFKGGSGNDPENWSKEHIVTVSGIHDVNLLDEFPTIRISGLAAVGATDAFVTVHQKDIDTQTVLLSTQTLTVEEKGAADKKSQTFTVTLAKQPPSSVTLNLTVAASLSGSVTVSAPMGLTFTTGSYNIPLPIVVTASDDENTNIETGDLTVALASQDSKVVTVTTKDPDRQVITITGSDLVTGATTNCGSSHNLSPCVSLNESQQQLSPDSKIIFVRLKYPPHQTDSETINIVATKVDVPTSLVFKNTTGVSGESWNVPRAVQIGAKLDADFTDEDGSIVLSSNLAPSLSWSAAPQTVFAHVFDKDVDIVVDSVTGTITESGSVTKTFNVSLTDPAVSAFVVDIGISVGDQAHAQVDHTSLTFQPSDGTNAKSFKVTGVVDNDAIDNTVTITLSSTSATNVISKIVQVTVTDNVAAPSEAGAEGDNESATDGGTDTD